jgi:predicted flap endonuclease-1-like 5' DNA nuclease
MDYKIQDIEGIGSVYGEKLAAAQIASTSNLLEHCATRSGRKKAAETTGVSETLLLKWTNMADMMRISGIGPQFAELLEASGVDTVKNLANAIPAASIITGWIDTAKTTEPGISY